MKKNFLILAAFAAVTMVGCQKGGDYQEPSQYIKISTEVSKPETRVTAPDANGNQEFESNDEIKVYGWVANDFTVVPTAAVVVNSVNKYDGTTWTPTPLMLWKDMTSVHSFAAIYPVQDITTFDAHPYDLALTTNVKDVMLATNTMGKKANDNEPITLAFDHVMSQVKVVLNYRNEFGDNPVATSVTINAKTDALLNLFTKTAAVSATATASEQPLSLLSSNGATSSYEAIFVPQNIRTVTINIGGNAYVYNHGTDFEFQGGKMHTITLNVGKNKVELGAVSVNGWGTGSDITGGEAQQ